MIEALAPAGGTILDLTLVYPRPTSFWEFLGGGVGPVEVLCETIAVTAVAPDQIDEWLNDRWQRKDEQLRNAILMGSDSDLVNLSEME